MSDEWDCYEPSEDDWAALDLGAFEFLGNIKSQSSTSTKALAGCLCRLKKPVGTVQQSKSKLATSIASVLLTHLDWSQASLATIRLAQVGGDKADFSSVLFAVNFRLEANVPVQHLVFRPMPADVAATPSAQRVSLVPSDATQPSAAPADPMAMVLALLQEQNVAMSEQKLAMNEHKAAMDEQKEA